jgi:hypothetical protein
VSIPTLPCWRPIYPFFHGKTYPWYTLACNETALDQDSAAICAKLLADTKAYPTGNGQSVPIYIVGPSQPLVPLAVKLSYEPWAPLIANAPIPAHAAPSPGQDKYLTVVQQLAGADQHLYELWVTAKDALGNWSCRGGIKRQRILTDNPGYSRNVRSPDGRILEQPSWGVCASHLSLCGGVIQVAEIQAGQINHALALIVRDSRQGQWAFPAQFTDGQDAGPCSIPYGAHFRLDPKLDLSALRLDPMMAMIAQACQRYGAIATDRTMVGTGFAFETAGQQLAKQGYDIWDLAPYNAGDWSKFPWEHMQLLPMDLRSAPDMTLHVESCD